MSAIFEKLLKTSTSIYIKRRSVRMCVRRLQEGEEEEEEEEEEEDDDDDDYDYD